MPHKLRDRTCASCGAPIWYNTFLTEWFHDEDADCAIAEPTPTTKRKSRNTSLPNTYPVITGLTKRERSNHD